MAIYTSFTGRGPKPRKPKPIKATLVPSPTRPPTGYYDPSIDHQVAAGARGLGDARIDIGTAKRRGLEDRDLTLADLMTGENRTREDARIATEDLGRQFTELGRVQAEQGRMGGVGMNQGLAARQQQIRSANQGRAQGRIDLSLNRALDDIGTQRGDVNRGYDRQFGAGGDLDLQLVRAEREQPLLEADANELRLGQARAFDYVPPMPRWKPPKGQQQPYDWTRPKKPKRGRGGG